MLHCIFKKKKVRKSKKRYRSDISVTKIVINHYHSIWKLTSDVDFRLQRPHVIGVYRT